MRTPQEERLARAHRSSPLRLALVALLIGAGAVAWIGYSRLRGPSTPSRTPAGDRGPFPEPAAAPARDDAPSPPAALPPAVVEGVVRYPEYDRSRWPLGRYYIKRASEALLAEAVVALRGDGLAGVSNAPPVVHLVDQVNFQFVPETIAVRAGDSVRFLNSDDETHNVFTHDGDRPFNVSLARGTGVSQRFREAGGLERPVRLGCVFHGAMRAWVFVFDHPFFAVTGADGRFRFEGVPPGSYRLEVAHPAGELRGAFEVSPAPGEALKVEIHVTRASGDGGSGTGAGGE